MAGEVMQRFLRILAWRSRQPRLLRWGGAGLLFLIALAARFGLGTLHGANPALVFYPLILLTTVFIGWKEALFVLCLAAVTGILLFLPRDQYLLPIGWLFVGSLNIAIIVALAAVTEELAAANERQRLLFLEAQHRVANTLQSVVGTLETAQHRIASSPADAIRFLEDAGRRFVASADVHLRLSDPTLFERPLDSILRDAVEAVIDRQKVQLHVAVDPIALSFDQMSTITMLVVEVANNSQKHVFGQGLGVGIHHQPEGAAGAPGDADGAR
jgi:hypothetical protein